MSDIDADAPGTRSTTGTRVAASYAGRTAALADFAIANGSTRPRDAIASAATGRRHDATGLVRLAHDAVTQEARAELAADIDLRRAGLLAHVIAHTARHDRDRDDALALLELIATAGGRSALDDEEVLDLLELLALAGRPRDVERLARELGVPESAPFQKRLLIRNAWRIRNGLPTDGLDGWARTMSHLYERDGLEALTAHEGTAAPFGRLSCPAAKPAPPGPRVTVLVGADVAWTAEGVGTLLAQTHQDLQILVVTRRRRLPSSHPWRVRDRRVRRVRVKDATSPAHARDLAVERYADGTYLTLHLPDVWVHPRTLERQVAFLEAHPEHAGCVVPAAEVTDDLVFLRPPGRPGFVGPDPATLLLRTAHPAREGGWDDVGELAELELLERVEAITGSRVPVVGSAPVRLRRTARAPGTPPRPAAELRWYTAAFRHWHAGAAPDELRRGPRTDSGRTVSAPVRMLPGAPRQGPVDVVYATEFRFPGGNTTLTRNEIETLVEAGHRVALLALESPLVRDLPVNPQVLETATRLDLPVLTLDDRLDTTLTVVRHPTVLQFAEPRRSGVRTERLVQIVNHRPHDGDGSHPMYDMTTVLATARAVFGVAAAVAPESATIRRLLDGLVDPDALTRTDWHGIVRWEAPPGPRQAGPGRPPVIGRHSRDGYDKWPDADILRLVYPVDGSRDVRVLGGAAQASQRAGLDVATAWTVHPFGSLAPRSFLDELDFWVYFHGPELVESFGMATVEALHAGLVVVLPPYMEATFGDAALYASPQDALDLVDRLWADPDAYRAQSARAIRRASEWFGPTALLHRIADLGVRPTGERTVTRRPRRLHTVSRLGR
ncbi:hypothetical protein [Myceligenerans cantabricum]